MNQETVLRQQKYLNNIIEQDHRFIKKVVKPMLGFKSFSTAEKTIAGIQNLLCMKWGCTVSIIVRECTMEDIDDVVFLMGELGYPTSYEDMKERFKNISSDSSYCTLLSEVEYWAKNQGAVSMSLNSGNRSEREAAHLFYQRIGFTSKSTGFIKVIV